MQKQEMSSIVIVILTVLSTIETIPDTVCNRIKIGEMWYNREILWANLGRPYNLNVHKTSNILFFSYSVPETYSDVDFQLAFFNIDTREYQTIAGIRGGCSVAIDQGNDEIYLGGSDGIYKYNMLTRLADFYKEKGRNIWSLFYKKNLFYISYPDQKLHIEIDGSFAFVREFEHVEVDHFHITQNNDIYQANKTGLYRYNNEKREIDVVNELVTVRQIVEDNDGELFVCTNFGIFKDGKFDGMNKIWDSKNIYGLAFDRDNNIIFSDDKRIYRLTNSDVGCNKSPHW